MDQVEIERRLHLGDEYSEYEKSAIGAEIQSRIGIALLDGMSGDRSDEFQHIVYDDADTIFGWLHTHRPSYQDEPLYKKIVEETARDGNPDNIRPEKVYASLEWLRDNVQDADGKTNQVLEQAEHENWREWLQQTAPAQ